MKVIKEILIKQVITQESKKKLESSFKQRKAELELECKQLFFEKKKLQKEKKNATYKIDQRFQVEIDNRKSEINQIKFKLEQLHQLPLGSEIIENKIDSIVDITLGMNWRNFEKEKAIIIKNDVVIRIDNE